MSIVCEVDCELHESSAYACSALRLLDIETIEVGESLTCPRRKIKGDGRVADYGGPLPRDGDADLAVRDIPPHPILPVGWHDDVAALVMHVREDKWSHAGQVGRVRRRGDDGCLAHAVGAVSGSVSRRDRPASLTVESPSLAQYSNPPMSSRTWV